MGMNGDFLTLAQAVGEAPPTPLTFTPGVDYDPTDSEECEIVQLAMERDMADRRRAESRGILSENQILRQMLRDAGIDPDEAIDERDIRPDNDF